MSQAAPNRAKAEKVVAPAATQKITEAVVAPQDDAEFAAAVGKPTVSEATQMLIERNGRYDFTAGGRPDLKKLAAIVGRTVTSHERDIAWEQLTDRRALN